MKPIIIAAGLVAASLAIPPAPAAATGKSPAQTRVEPGARTVADPLTPAQRGELARQFVLKWGDYVQRVHGLDAGTWAQRMVGTFVSADALNFRQALKRSTYEGAMVTLDGQGHRVTDNQIIDALAASKAGVVEPYALGDTTGDLVFTPLQPCRILDTRSAGGGGGVLPGNSVRVFSAWGLASFAGQGGSATDCGLLNESPEAIAVNLTAVTPAQTGYAKLFPASGPSPATATIVYEAGKTLSNAAVVKLGAWGQYDFSIYTERDAHYVVDIVGYYDAPRATPLQCYGAGTIAYTVAAATRTYFTHYGTCPAGYVATTPYCWTDAAGVYSQGSGFVGNNPGGATFCAWSNTTSNPQTVYGGNVCCRVPGR